MNTIFSVLGIKDLEYEYKTINLLKREQVRDLYTFVSLKPDLHIQLNVNIRPANLFKAMNRHWHFWLTDMHRNIAPDNENTHYRENHH